MLSMIFRKIKCPGAGCAFETKKKWVLGFCPGLVCPNCQRERIYLLSGPPHFHCNKCNSDWSRISCPRCGTGIPADQGCYVATCVYGSFDCPEVLTLRRYRDDVLSNSRFGRGFISVYYAVSPKIVTLFGNQKWFHRMCKPCIDALVTKLRKKGMDSSR